MPGKRSESSRSWTAINASVFGIVAVLVGLSLCQAARAQHSDPQTLIQEILGMGRYQCHLPGPTASGGDGPAEADCIVPVEPDRAPSIPRASSGETVDLSGFFRLLLWFVLIAGVALLAVDVMRRLKLQSWRKAERGTPTNPGSSWQEDLAGMADPDGQFAAADALAAKGAWSMAIHALLLSALQKLPQRLDGAFPASWTGRELVRRAPIPDEQADTLAHLVGASESAHFADRPASATDYDACRDHYLRFRQWVEAG